MTDQPKTLGDLIKEAVADAIAAVNVQEGAGTAGAQVPKVEHAPQTPEEVAQLGQMFAEYRAEIAALRREIASSRPRVIHVPAEQETPEQRAERRIAAIAEASHYCPGCGNLGKYAQKCTGITPGSHPPLEMVSTDELGGDPADHTPAPSTDEADVAAALSAVA